jgi:hypothetical protein
VFLARVLARVAHLLEQAVGLLAEIMGHGSSF